MENWWASQIGDVFLWPILCYLHMGLDVAFGESTDVICRRN